MATDTPTHDVPGRLPEVLASSDLALVIEQAIAAHKAWMHAFERAIEGIDADRLAQMSVADQTACGLGRWLHAVEQDALDRYAVFRSIRSVHVDFHRYASAILDDLAAGDVDGAQHLLLSRLRFTSRLLVLLLEQFREPATEPGPAGEFTCRFARWLVEDLADECPELWLLIEQDNCHVCSALLGGKKHGMMLVT